MLFLCPIMKKNQACSEFSPLPTLALLDTEIYSATEKTLYPGENLKIQRAQTKA